jgi:hypothetical protein
LRKKYLNSQSVGGSGVLATPANVGCEDGFARQEQLVFAARPCAPLAHNIFGAASSGQWMHHYGSQSHNHLLNRGLVQQQQLSCRNYFYEF